MKVNRRFLFILFVNTLSFLTKNNTQKDTMNLTPTFL